MRSATTNHSTQGNHRIARVLGQNLTRQHRQLKSARCHDNSDVAFRYTMTTQCINSTFNQAVNNKTVEAGGQDDKAAITGNKISLNLANSTHAAVLCILKSIFCKYFPVQAGTSNCTNSTTFRSKPVTALNLAG